MTQAADRRQRLNKPLVGNGLLITFSREVSADFTVAKSDYLINVTASGAVVATLPSVPSDGEEHQLVRASGTADITLSGAGGKTINGESSIVLGAGVYEVTVRFDATADKWLIRSGGPVAKAGVLDVTGSLNISGTAGSAAADTVKLGSADANGAGTAGLKMVFEGGGALLQRQMSNAGVTSDLVYDQDVVDDGSISLPVLINGGLLQLSAGVEGGLVSLAPDGSVTILAGSTNLVGTDTDAKLCVFDGGTSATIRNRLGATKRVQARLIGS